MYHYYEWVSWYAYRGHVGVKHALAQNQTFYTGSYRFVATPSDSGGRLEDITLNVITSLPPSHDSIYIIEVVDHLSKSSHFGALPTTFIESKVAELFVSKVVWHHVFLHSIVFILTHFLLVHFGEDCLSWAKQSWLWLVLTIHRHVDNLRLIIAISSNICEHLLNTNLFHGLFSLGKIPLQLQLLQWTENVSILGFIWFQASFYSFLHLEFHNYQSFGWGVVHWWWTLVCSQGKF